MGHDNFSRRLEFDVARRLSLRWCVGSQVLELIDQMELEDMAGVIEDESVALPCNSTAAVAQKQGDTDALASALAELGLEQCKGLLRKHFGID